MRRAFGIALLLLMAAMPGASAESPHGGQVRTASAASPALGEDIRYTVYLPRGYDRDTVRRFPVLYLLHGRGDTMTAWTRVKPELDRMIARREIPPVLAVLPDAPWSGRGNYYVDSAHTGGRPVETALTRDLVSHVDSTYRTVRQRDARLVGGYSMGGAGALRYALAHQDTFGHALVLSPAVYTPLPPAESSAREFGAYGSGERLFDEQVYRRLNYPALLPLLRKEIPTRLYIAVGDDEWPNPDPAEARHDIDFESAALYNSARRGPGVTAELRISNGGHDWKVWTPAFADALRHFAPSLRSSCGC
ncbi:esterase family protein [Allokutzneria sp. A3M-2-11 16]|uniref:alpha/beta hydrolase n=1 Tax=Allokutzneria sp. A3M-2-11 16 TaxID=2962043 RepID=UPI0020B84A59|nr:alpha/beta hydrolase-fold protein [Allokutzneria sp. A3M-2-11 16]MCP3803178.1 esterase family protein [Allokutzneria sp. A3M-2-11 16]